MTQSLALRVSKVNVPPHSKFLIPEATMKFSRQFKSLSRRSARRNDGITVIEVLTSLVVATIGVFGVLVLIPFAVKQSQLGLDQDAAEVIGRNAIQDMQIYGFTRVDNDGNLQLRGAKVNLDPNNGTTIAPVYATPLGNPLNAALPQPAGAFPGMRLGTYATPLNISGTPPGQPIDYPQVIHFDPVAVAEIGFPVVDGAVVNPDFLTGLIPPRTGGSTDSDGGMRSLNPLRVTVATAASGGTFVFGGATYNDILRRPELEKIFRSFDDQTYSNVNLQSVEVTDTELPQPVFDVSSQGNPVKRQALGKLSWSAVLVPQKDDGVLNAGPPSFPPMPTDAPSTIATKYKVYVLVYGDRSLTPLSVASAPLATDIERESLMLAAEVLRRTTTAIATPNTNGGFDSEVKRINLAPGTATTGVFKDDWVMLINRKPLADYSVTPPVPSTLPVPVRPESGPPVPLRLDADEEGYRIQVGFAKVLSVDQGTVNPALSVQGGPFNFYYTDVHGGTGFGGAEAAYTSATYVVHLKNVLNVYERTISLERDSVWN